MKMLLTKFYFLFILFIFQKVEAADLKKLTTLFKQMYETHYTHISCGRNIQQFLVFADKAGIDLNNAEVWKVKGNGFWATSGFHTRLSTSDRTMLGFFHVILIADNYIFDFDLHGGYVLSKYHYARLQFTPAQNPFAVASSQKIDFHEDLVGWTIEAFDAINYSKNAETKLWMKNFLDIFLPNIIFSVNRSEILAKRP
jgi:hypothetical protein